MSKLRSGKVSIIIPVWGDYTKYLERCLTSVKNQTYKNIEVIIVDDETDLPSARNKGVCKSNGEYVLCLDVDDQLMPNAIEKMVNEGGDIITFNRVSQNGSLMICDKKFSVDDFMEGNRIIACSMFKRKVWDTIGGYDETLVDGYEDWDFWLAAVKEGFKITYLEEVLYIQEYHEDSMIGKTIQKHEELKKYICKKHL